MSRNRPRSPAPAYRYSPVHIACVQYDVKLGQVKENSSKVEFLTSSIRPGSLDLLVLPEMCLSGYIFPNPSSILPYLEIQGTGPTSMLAKSLARRLKCYVIAGYPEALPTTSVPTSQFSISKLETPKSEKEVEEDEGVGYNSAMVVSPSGEVVGNYRKTFRFDTDKNWAREGDGFRYFDLPEPLGRVAIGICMDMNPRDFIAPWDAYELATFCRDNKVDMLVVPMNWLDPEPPADSPPEDYPIQNPDEPSKHNINYWLARLSPLHDPSPGYEAGPIVAGEGKEVIFVACNRVGEEKGTKFVGTSCIMTLSTSPSRVELVECCNASEERVMIASIP
ncbi:protein N-terminal amidase [Tremella mesenterica]|uniref:Protein N-terminal amidase n=1 Tax=Tremella mesenterica TaxID=5217 RepID=A0A4Q1BI67_TREME|nr:protein N-terminal amidase [Tremella mesenterica]